MVPLQKCFRFPIEADVAAFLILLFGLGGVCRAREIVPGLVSFGEPSGYLALSHVNDPGDNPFDLSRMVVAYREIGNNRPPFKQFEIGVATLGYTIGNGKVVVYRKLGPDDLKREFQAWATGGTGTAPPVQECMVSGRKAYTIYVEPSTSEKPSVWREVYYIPFEENRGIYLSLSGPSASDVSALRQFLLRIKIPADAHIRQPSPPPPPSVDEVRKQRIIDNLRTIMGAGDQCSVRHWGTHKFTFAEMRQDFPREFGKITPIDGENYETVVYDQAKPLTVTTRTMGEIHYP